MDPTSLHDQLVKNHDALIAFLRKCGAGLSRFESAEDLAQGIHARVLTGADDVELPGEAEFRSWLFTIARRHVADRNDYWSALKRGAGRVARLTFGLGSRDHPTRAVRAPAAPMGTPSSFAAKREMLELVAKALAVLPARDRRLVQAMSLGVSLEEQATELGLTYSAAQRAGLRAVERLRKTVELIRQGVRPAEPQ
ncbi:MAG: sigma-70 family RNA polymerase sigma factor [bacterium]|nr:sigma-70 family RNA polymerase sigma factor [bacterium]